MIQNCKIHNGGPQLRPIKLQQSDYITLEDCELYSLGAGGGMIDCVWVEHTISKRNYLHDGLGAAGFYKGGSMYCTFDSNVNTPPQAGILTYGFMPGGETGVGFRQSGSHPCATSPCTR